MIPGARSGFVCDSTTDLVALSADDGASWRKVKAPTAGRTPGCLGGKDVDRWVDPVAFDRAGQLYALWTDSRQEPGRGWRISRHRFLRDGSIAVVTPIQNPAKQRLGFTWRRVR